MTFRQEEATSKTHRDALAMSKAFPDTKVMAVGTLVPWAGETLRIAEIGLGVILEDAQGRRQYEIPYASAVEAVQRESDPPPYQTWMHRIDDHEGDRRPLPKAQAAKLKYVRETLCILTTGLKPEDHPNDVPPDDLNPKLVPTLSTRVTNLARQRSTKLRTSGPRAGHRVQLTSERKKIERLLSAWRDGGEPACIDKRLGRGGHTYSRQADVLWDELKEWLFSGVGHSNRSRRAKVRQFVVDRKANGVGVADLPSESTLWNIMRDLEEQYPRILTGSAASRESGANVPAPSYCQRDTSHPGELVLFDTTKANVEIVDPRTGRKYRPEITLALDHNTRAFVGMSISVVTSAIGVALCLADILRPKTHDAVTDWSLPGDPEYIQPYVGKPATYGHIQAFRPESAVADNGRPFLAAYTTSQMSRLHIDYEPQRSYTPTDKAQIERAFRTIKDMFESLMSGYTGGSIYDRGRKSGTENLMTATLFERRLRQCIDIYNNKIQASLVLEDDPFVPLTPFMMWRIAIERQGPITVPAWKYDWVHTLPHQTVQINAGGFRLNRLQYKSPLLLARLRDDHKLAEGRSIRVFYNPTDLRSVWTFESNGEPHEIRWALWHEDLRRFGEMATSGAAKLYGGRGMTDRQFFEHLTSTAAAWKVEDASITHARYDGADNLYELLSADEQRKLLDEELIDDQIVRNRNLGLPAVVDLDKPKGPPHRGAESKSVTEKTNPSPQQVAVLPPPAADEDDFPDDPPPREHSSGSDQEDLAIVLPYKPRQALQPVRRFGR